MTPTNVAAIVALTAATTIMLPATANATMLSAIKHQIVSQQSAVLFQTGARRNARGSQKFGNSSRRRQAVSPGVASYLILRRKCLDKLFPSRKKGACAKVNF